MTERPTLAEQIEAVKWAAKHVEDMVGGADKAWLIAALDAAVETLGHLEFIRETLP